MTNKQIEPNQPIDNTWYVDSSKTFLGFDQNNLFDTAVAQLMQYQIYPPLLMTIYGEFKIEGRFFRVGENILQQIHLIPKLLDCITVSRITSFLLESNRKGFTFVTTQKHLLSGEKTVVIVRHKDGSVYIMTQSISKFNTDIPAILHPIARLYQKWIQRTGIKYFKTLLMRTQNYD